MVVDGIGPALATLRSNKLPLHVEHLPERFGLFVILVLGEALGGVVRGVHDAHWAGPAVLAGLVGFVAVAALWWVYFDVGADESADDLAETEAADAEPSEDAVDERIHELLAHKRQLFEEYAGTSVTADAAPEATDAEIARQVIAAERERLLYEPPAVPAPDDA